VTDFGRKLSYSQFRKCTDTCLEELTYTTRCRGKKFLYLNLKPRSPEEEAGMVDALSNCVVYLYLQTLVYGF
jgi:hypothetical protein